MNEIETLVIRDLEERDLMVLAHDLGLSRHHIADRWRERVSGQRTMLIADVDGRMTGSVSFDRQDRRSELLHLFALGVVPAAQGRGIGTRLIEAVEQEALDRGLGGAYLAVAIDNVEAIRLYDRLGYVRTGAPYTSRRTWYGANGESRNVVERCFRMVKRTTG